jgi:hypothetical protein
MIYNLSLFEVTVFTFSTGGCFTCLTQLGDACMRIVAQHTVEDPVFALGEFAILFMVLDEAVVDIYIIRILAQVALSALLCVANDQHPHPLGIIDM